MQKLRKWEKYALVNSIFNNVLKSISIICLVCTVLMGEAYAQHSKRDLLDIENAVLIKHKPEGQNILKANDNRRDFERFPIIEYKIDTTKLGYIQTGETIPDIIWEMPLRIVNHPEGKGTTSLKELSDKQFLILDFWAKWCKPCLASMNNWEKMRNEIESDIRVVGVHLDYDYKAEIEARDMGWKSIQIVGKEAHILKRYLNQYAVMGPSVWLKGRRLFGISKSGPSSYDFVQAIIRGETNAIPDYALWKPF